MRDASGLVAELVEKILVMLQSPQFFRDILSSLGEVSYRQILLAWSEVRENHNLLRDEYGRYVLEPKG